MELHKDGKSNRKISEALGIGSSTVDEFIKALPGNALGAKAGTPNGTPSDLPLAIEKPPLRYAFYTEDRPETLSGIFEIPEGQYEVLPCSTRWPDYPIRIFRSLQRLPQSSPWQTPKTAR